MILRRIRLLLGAVILGLILSGATAIPLESELKWLTNLLAGGGRNATPSAGLHYWLAQACDGIVSTNAKYPFIGYGTDWLAFAHFVIAIAFIGPLRDPLRNLWVVEFGMIACVLVVPFALVMGEIRGIPLFWRLIDCSFGVFGAVPLFFMLRMVRDMEAEERGRARGTAA